MGTIEKIAIFYAVASAVVGLMVASMREVNFTFRGRPMPCPRLLAGLASAAFWPAIVFKIFVG